MAVDTPLICAVWPTEVARRIRFTAETGQPTE